jgi:ABC-type multidrug transport system fused ATPase/permease subunit
LRSRISIIPQEPSLFHGTIRYNLDPFDQYTDAELWAVLQNAQLSSKVQQNPGGLQAEISESGSNFSIGERQLFCLARAMLRYDAIAFEEQQTNLLHSVSISIQSSPYRAITFLNVSTGIPS